MPGFRAFFGHLEKAFPSPVVDHLLIALGVRARIHLAHVESGIILQVINAGTGRCHGAAIAGRNGQPATIDLGAILRRSRDLAVFVEQRVHDVVDRDEPVFLRIHIPGPHPHNVMPGTGLPLGHQSQQVLVAV